MIKNVSLIAHGQVQGVGFRYATQKIALSMDIVGTVKNNIDGTVAIEAQGPEDTVNEFIKQLKKGPSPFANVTSLESLDNNELKNYKDFSVIG